VDWLGDLSDGKTSAALRWRFLYGLQIGDAEGVLELLWLLTMALLGGLRPCHDLVLENLLLRHQLAVLTRPTRTRSHARLRLWDKLLWVLARRFCSG
jgi:hypothetical protein